MVQMGLAHRDLKSPNVLMKSLSDSPVPYRAVICDFGITRVSEERAIVKKWKGLQGLSPKWAAPETFRRFKEGTLGQTTMLQDWQADVYSFTCIMHDLITRGGHGKAWEGKTAVEISEEVIAGERPHIAKNGEEDSRWGELKGLIEKGWRDDPDKRPTFGEIEEEIGRLSKKDLNHPSIKNAYY
eukprot:Lithocolla_globosa_v1_NODE_2165_length_2129_cov_3.848120.p2 type:complete len:184 gc:universal NODE_2165_length_2129_cov_3.848120:1524-2075(+)